MNLKIDPEFRDKIPPLSQNEFSKLEENILADGEIREPLVVWNGTIIDGHHRWKIIQKHPDIPYKIKEMDFPDKWAAIVWMCRNQLGRRNLTDEQKTVLIGVAYKAQKITRGSNNQYVQAKSEKDQNGPFHKKFENTAQKIADDFNVGEQTVKRAGHFVDGLEAAEKVSPGIKDAVLSGDVKAPKSVIAEIRNLPEDKKVEVVEAIKRKDIPSAKEFMRPIPTREDDTPEFTVEDLKETLHAAMAALDSSLKLHLVLTHNEMLKSAGAREAAALSWNPAETGADFETGSNYRAKGDRVQYQRY